MLSWGRVQFEKGFQVLARAMTIGPHQSARRPLHDRRPRQLPPRAPGPDRRRRCQRHRRIAGFVGDAELRRLTQRAGCVVIPSLYEPFGLVALEALAAGAPLIVARTGGLAELIEGTDAGLTFEPGRPDDLASCIERVLNDPYLAARADANARELIDRKYSWEAIAAATAACYRGDAAPSSFTRA